MFNWLKANVHDGRYYWAERVATTAASGLIHIEPDKQ